MIYTINIEHLAFLLLMSDLVLTVCLEDCNQTFSLLGF